MTNPNTTSSMSTRTCHAYSVQSIGLSTLSSENEWENDMHKYNQNFLLHLHLHLQLWSSWQESSSKMESLWLFLFLDSGLKHDLCLCLLKNALMRHSPTHSFKHLAWSFSHPTLRFSCSRSTRSSKPFTSRRNRLFLASRTLAKRKTERAVDLSGLTWHTSSLTCHT